MTVRQQLCRSQRQDIDAFISTWTTRQLGQIRKRPTALTCATKPSRLSAWWWIKLPLWLMEYRLSNKTSNFEIALSMICISSCRTLYWRTTDWNSGWRKKRRSLHFWKKRRRTQNCAWSCRSKGCSSRWLSWVCSADRIGGFTSDN